MSKRICLLRPSYFPGDSHVRRNVDTLIEDGFEVDVICQKQPGEAFRDTYRGGAILRLPVSHKRNGALGYIREYLTFFSLALILLTMRQLQRRYHTIEVYNLPDTLVFAALPARLFGARVVFYMFEVMPEQAAEQLNLGEGHPFIRFLRLQQAWVTRLADAVIVVSDYDRDLLARHNLRREPIVIMNVPPRDLFQPVTTHDCSPDRFLLFTHGSLLPRYDVATLIRALGEITNVIPEAKLRIVGEGESRSGLESLAKAIGVSSQVQFTGWLPYDQIAAEIAEADVCIVAAPVPWLLPNKIFEYAAMAKPVIAAQSPSLSRVFETNSLVYFHPGDARDLGSCILDLYRSHQQRVRLGCQAHDIYLRYEWSQTRLVYLDLHRKLAGGVAS